MKHYLIFILLLLASCATQKKQILEEVVPPKKKPISFIDENLTRNGYLVKAQTKEISVGEVELLTFELPVKILFKLRCSEKKEIPYFFRNNQYYAFVEESYFSKRKKFSCWAEGENLKMKVADFVLVQKSFPAEKLTVNRKRVQLSKKDKNRVWTEQKFLNRNYASSPAQPLFNSPFELPINSLVTSIYGTQRVFNNIRKSQHLGTDYRAKVGTNIKAANDGQIVVSRDLFYTGGTVTIDHGLNIFTIYGHLSKLLVKEGDYVKKGDIIALSGKSGRVTGPHLHWGVKVDGDFIEGDSLIEASQKIDIATY